MTTKQQIKEIGTSLTIAIFAVISITGILMFFHILDKYTKEMHEIFGLIFVVASLIHIYKNFYSIKKYFTNKIFIIASVAILVGVFGFIAQSIIQKGEDPKKLIITSFLNAKLEKSLEFLGTDIKSAQAKLIQKGIVIGKSDSLIAIAQTNKKSPFEVIAILTEN